VQFEWATGAGGGHTLEQRFFDLSIFIIIV
jgi:hypothetical protein